jgi:hypothetical protein
MYLTKFEGKLRSSSVPEFVIFVYKYRVPIWVATPTGLVAMVIKVHVPTIYAPSSNLLFCGYEVIIA